MSKWTGKPTSFSKDAREYSLEKFHKISGEMFQGVVTASPVDSGTFRSNHRSSINSQDNSFDNSTDNPATVISRGLLILNQSKLGDTVYIQNNLPYAERIEHGWSKQAEQGVYGITFAYVVEKNK